MSEQQHVNYERIAQAIVYINENFRDQPSLEEVASKVNLSPYHFQRIFKEWTGVTPKKFLQYVSIENAKKILNESSATIFEATMDSGLSGTGRLHDLFVNIEGMTPGEYKNGGKQLSINYSYAHSPFGMVVIASTSKGLCHVAFTEDEERALYQLKNRFPQAAYQQRVDQFQLNALMLFTNDWSPVSKIKLHLKGTDFQLKVWEALLKIPQGGLATYGAVAKIIDKPKAARAVGLAIGSNPIAFLIPCHRVIQASGNIGQYMWGSTRKTAMIGWEASLLVAND